jgi:hypothetical protein
MSYFNNPHQEEVFESVVFPKVKRQLLPEDHPIIIITLYPPVMVRKQMTEEMIEIMVYRDENQLNEYQEINRLNDEYDKSKDKEIRKLVRSLDQGVHFISRHRIFEEDSKKVYQWFKDKSGQMLGLNTTVVYRVDGE